MAITSVKEIFQRAYEGDSSSRRHVRTFRVISDNWTDGPYTARLATGVPRQGDSHPNDSFARCARTHAAPQDDLPDTFIVTCEYETPTGGVTGSDNENPLLRPVRYSGSGERFGQPIRWADFLGRRTQFSNGTFTDSLTSSPGDPLPKLFVPVVNSAGEPFDPLPEEDASAPTMVCVRNELPDLYQIVLKQATYLNRINLDAFGSLAAPGFAKIIGITYQDQFENTVRFFEVTYTIQFATTADGFNIVLHDAGNREIDAATKRLKTMTDDNGAMSPPPLPLNGFGVKLSLPNPIPPGGNPPYPIAHYRIYRRNQGAVNFAPLGLV